MTGARPVVYLGLGSNLGNRRANLAVALSRLEPLVRVQAVSSLYETDPAGIDQQPPFYNAACRATTGLEPQALLRHLKEVEYELGRRPGPRWGPRPIDIDLLLFDEAVIDQPDLRVPHREMSRRAFVLMPLAELAGDVRHPELGRAISSLANNADASGVRRLAAPGWERS